jgi:MFS transporter, ACS family, glucarate transporter
MSTATRLRTAGMTHVRWEVIAFLFVFSFVTVVDRVAISSAQSDIAHDLGLSNMAFGFVFGAFALGYALFQVPGGLAADRLGPRAYLTMTVLLWSLFTGLTGAASGLALLVAIRFLFGCAEAGIYPTCSRATYNWVPVRERGVAQGCLFLGSRLGAAFGLSVVSFMIVRFGWRESFWILAGCGIALAGIWYVWFRNYPQEKRRVSAAEIEYIHGDPPAAITERSREGLGRLLLSGDARLLMVQYFASNFTFFIAFSWLLPYLRDQYHLSASAAGSYASIPLYFGALANWMSGIAVDRIYRRGHWRASRMIPAVAGFALGAVALIATTYMRTIAGAVVCFALATLGVDLTLSPSWTSCQDIAGEHTGAFSGTMNMVGNIGSFFSSVTFPLLLKVTGSANTYFYVGAAINIVGMLCWFRIRPERTS